MQNIYISFEKELKHRLNMKSNPHLSEEAILLKAFKYFDLSNTGKTNKKQFIFSKNKKILVKTLHLYPR